MKTETKSLIAAYISVSIILASAGIIIANGINARFSATWYQSGSITASGEEFDPTAMTCAHPRAPFGAWLKVTTRDQVPEQTIYVRVNDRIKGEAIDLTPAAFKQLAPLERGKILVTVYEQ